MTSIRRPLNATLHSPSEYRCYSLNMAHSPSDHLTSHMPIVSHEDIPGVDCCGCIIAAVDGSNVELRCNECGAVVGVVQIDILRGLLGLATPE